MQPNTTFTGSGYAFGDASLCALDFRIDENIAQEGTAVYSNTDACNAGSDYIGSDWN